MKTIISDLDGTLLNDGELSTETIETLKQFQENNRLVLATGRNLNSVKKIYQQLEMDKYQTGALILINGLAFYDFKDQEFIYLNSFKEKDITKIIKIAYRFFFRITIVTKEKRLTIPNLYDKIYQILRFLIKHKPIEKTKKEKIPAQAEKIELGGTIFFDFFLRRLKRSLHNYEVVQVSRFWIEILPKRTNKVNQVKYLIDKYQIALDDLYVFGDGENDFEMLKYANNSYAPEDALPEAKQVAKFSCLSARKNGVAKVVYQLIK